MPRKTAPRPDRTRQIAAASMRPRPDAAENGRLPVGRGERRAASMRPRPDAAENFDAHFERESDAAGLQ